MEQDQTPIICDTNIWYNIGSGAIPEAYISDKQLFGTFFSGYEFCSSFNIVNNYALSRGAVKAYNEKTVGLYVSTPTEHLKNVSGHAYHTNYWNVLRTALEYIILHERVPNEVLARENIEALTAQHNLDNRPILGVVDELRNNIASIKGYYKAHMKKAEVREKHLDISKQLITTFVDGLSVDWNQLELFLLTFDEWFRQLALQPTLIITPNDWNDILNLVYVQPGSLYWTKDNRKTKTFIRQCGCSHYLLE